MRVTSCVALLWLWFGAPCSAEDAAVLTDSVDGVAPRQMLDQYLLKQAVTALDARRNRLAAVHTDAERQKYVDRLRAFFLAQLDGLPERTPLHAQVVGRIAGRDGLHGFRVEKIIFESQPRHFVTAVLYLPRAEGRHAAVLFPCGHSANGKAFESYQQACILLASNGVAALCYDPIGQGERRQIMLRPGEKAFTPDEEHTLLGIGSILLGTNTARYRVWDGMRALDYLSSRDDIDPKKLGCAGNSGGGTMTSYLMALDERIVAAVPGCYLTSLERLLETIGPQDAEQCLHNQLTVGLDHADFLLLHAPRPVLIAAARDDYFDIQGTRDTFRQARQWYTDAGWADRVDLLEADGPHGFSPTLRAGMTRWMRRWLCDDTAPTAESEHTVFTDAQLQCTPDGQTLRLDGAQSVYDLNADLARRYSEQRKSLWQKTDRTELLHRVRVVAGIPRLADMPDARVEIVSTTERDGYRLQKLIIRPEPGIALPGEALLPQQPSGEAWLVLGDHGHRVAAQPGGELVKRVRAGDLVLAVDVRGSGETAVEQKKEFDPMFGRDEKTYFLAYMLGKSYVGMRATDILGFARELHDNTRWGKVDKLHLIASGEIGPPALHAAALEPQLFATVRLRRSLVSWDSVVHTPRCGGHLIQAVHGALQVYDLPDLAGLVQNKLTVEDPVEPAHEPKSAE